MYTTEKKISKLSNQLILSWLVVAFALIRLAFKDYSSFDSFQAIGNFWDVILMIAFGITIMISSNRNIKKIKGFAFDIDESEFIYKTFDEELIFNVSSPAKTIKKTLKAIEISTIDDRKIRLCLDDFLLEYKELKKIDEYVTRLNQLFQEATANNNS